MLTIPKTWRSFYLPSAFLPTSGLWLGWDRLTNVTPASLPFIMVDNVYSLKGHSLWPFHSIIMGNLKTDLLAVATALKSIRLSHSLQVYLCVSFLSHPVVLSPWAVPVLATVNPNNSSRPVCWSVLFTEDWNAREQRLLAHLFLTLTQIFFFKSSCHYSSYHSPSCAKPAHILS